MKGKKYLLIIVSATILLVITISVSCSHKKSQVSLPLKDLPSKDSIPAKNKNLALKPPMGWNSYDCFGLDVNETEVRANAEYMAKHLKDLGYQYIVLDILWYGDEKASNYDDFVHETIPAKPKYTLDEFGRYLPDPVKFPSSVNNAGFKPLADYIHSLGLKFGIHILRGIPW